MSATFKVVIKPTPSKDGRHLIMVRITVNRKVVYQGTGIRVKQSDWNDKGTFEKGNWIRSSNPMYEVYNRSLKNQINTLDEKYHVNSNLSAFALKSSINQNSQSFTQYFHSFILRLESASLARKNKYKSTLNKLLNFVNGRELFLSDLTTDFILKFENYLLSFNKRNTASKTLSFLKAVINQLYKDNPTLVTVCPNPFVQVKLRYEKTTKTRLTPEEIELIEKADLAPTAYATNRENHKNLKHHSRNIFLLQYYFAGTRISDMLLAQKKHFASGRFIYRSKKTDTPRNFKIPDKAAKILGEYLPLLQDEDFVFPFLPLHAQELILLSSKNDKAAMDKLDKLIESKTTIISKNLKLIAKELGINKNISTHVARHSFADQARKNKTDVYAISKALGHSRITVTEDYLDSFDTDAIDGVIDSVVKQ